MSRTSWSTPGRQTVRFRELLETDNASVAALVRDNLKKDKLDIPGTAFFDEGLDLLSDHYGNDGCKYFVIEDDHGQVIGGIGFARFKPMEDTAELQKLYLRDSAKGSGLGYEMIDFIEERMPMYLHHFSSVLSQSDWEP